ncbi:MAG: sulfatase, partial [Myxococcota bacterium]
LEHARRSRGALIHWFALPWLVVLLACSRSSPDSALSSIPTLPGDSPSVILVSIDTLRADHLGCYGYSRPTSPRIDAFAASAVRFSEGYSGAPWTLPAHAQMLTGHDPYALGVIHKRSALPDGVPLLAEILASAGYETAAFVDSSKRGLVGAERGFARGFHEYHHAPHRDGLAFEYDARVTMEVALEWLRERRDRQKPFFLFLHTKSVHSVQGGTPRADERTPPYDVPRGDRFRFVTDEQARLSWSSPELGASTQYLSSLNEAYRSGERDPGAFPAERRDALVGLYDGAIRYTDEQFGALLDGLATLQLLDSTLVVLTADHGEEFLDHGRLLHEQVYRELLHVPLIIRFPGQHEGRVVAEDVSLADIVPTLVDWLGVSTSFGFAGRSLLEERPRGAARALLASYHEAIPSDNRPLLHGLCRSLSRRFTVPPSWLSGCVWAARHYSLRRGDWTLVYNEFLDGREPTTELYGNQGDSLQQHAIPDAEVAGDLLSALREGRERMAVEGARAIAVDEETRKHLEALGYVTD